MASLALVSGAILVGILLRVERNRNRSASWALWIPTVWMLIYGSRSVSRWFDSGTISLQNEQGSPLDRSVLLILILLGLVVLSRRAMDWAQILKDNQWLLVLFLYMGASTLWSDFPLVSLKRWIRSSGSIVIALVILSEAKPLHALETVLRRCAYVLIPFSLVLVKYFPDYGRAYGRWDGVEMWLGVTTQKNSLGQLCAVSIFLLVWTFLRDWRAGNAFKRKSQACADGLVLGIAIFLLQGPGGHSYSATSITVVVMGTAVLLLMQGRESLARSIGSYAKVLLVALVGAYQVLADWLVSMTTSALDRDATLTGRTDIWQVLLEVASENPLFGVGYGGFWGLNPVSAPLEVSQAHNGFLDVYLELGLAGVVLLSVFLLSFCSRVQRELQRRTEWGTFGLCFLLMTLVYNIGESAFFDVYLAMVMVMLTIACSAPPSDLDGPPQALDGQRRWWTRASRSVSAGARPISTTARLHRGVVAL